MNTKTKPVHFCNNPVSGYPLTDGELSVLAEHWWDVALDHAIWWTLSGCIGGDEVRERNHALGRLDLLAGQLGEGEIDRLREEAEARWRARLGEEPWAAYKNGRAIYQEEAQRRTRRRERRARKRRK